MSYIHNSYVCATCGTNVNYAWMFPDTKSEYLPDVNKIVLARVNSVASKYIISVKCPVCPIITSFEYDKNGILLKRD